MIKLFATKIDYFLKVFEVKKYLNRRYLDYFLLAFSLFLGLYLDWDITNILIFVFVIWQILYPLSRLTLSKISLVLIALLPVLFFLKEEDLTEKLAILVFCLLSLTFAMTISERLKTRKGESI